MKKYLIAGGFLIGGYFLIKKILPKITSSKTEKISLEESKNSSDVVDDILKSKAEKRKKIDDELKTHYNEDGTKNRNWYVARNNFKL